MLFLECTYHGVDIQHMLHWVSNQISPIFFRKINAFCILSTTTLYNVILCTARYFLETWVIIKISIRPYCSKNFDWFSWEIIFCFKISQSFLGSKDGSKFWWFPWFPENSLLCVILRYRVDVLQNNIRFKMCLNFSFKHVFVTMIQCAL